MSRRHDDVLTDYVRERLDRLVSASHVPGASDEQAALRTVLRPRPALVHAHRDPDHGPPDWWGQRPEPAGGAEVPEAKPTPPEPAASAGSRVAYSPAQWLTRFTRQHLLVVGVVLALGVLVAAFAVTRARAVPVTPPVPVAVASSLAQPAPSSPPVTSPAPAPIRVHVVGEVARPGVHQLPLGARVADAIDAAGGLTEKARPGELNLAQALADGQQVVIGGPQRPTSEVRGGGDAGVDAPAAAAGSGGGSPSGKLNLNTATAAQLDTLPGVGPVTAEKVVAWRAQHGKFTRIEELQEVPGIGPKTYEEIAPHVTV